MYGQLYKSATRQTPAYLPGKVSARPIPERRDNSGKDQRRLYFNIFFLCDIVFNT